MEDGRVSKHSGQIVLCVAAIAAAVLQACGKEPASAARGRDAAAAARVRPALETALKAAGLRFGDPVFVRAFKEERLLELFVLNRASNKFVIFRTYPIAATSGELGPKLAAGDGQVPEGFYCVTAAAMKPDSTYHLAFSIG
jgi:murein L,D-transpeptidase YafK